MIRFINPFAFYNDDIGRTLPKAELFFYDNRTTALQNVYMDSALTTLHPSPVIADDNGRFPDIWMIDQEYTIELYRTDGEFISRIDDYNFIPDRALSANPLIVKTVADLKTGTLINGNVVNFTEGTVVDTLGYTTLNDGQSGRYQVVRAGSGFADDGSLIALDNGLQAKLINLQHQKNNSAAPEGNISLTYGKDPFFQYYPNDLTQDSTFILNDSFTIDAKFMFNLRGDRFAFNFAFPQAEITTLIQNELLIIQAVELNIVPIFKTTDIV